MGGKPYIMGFVRDISARKVAEEQLKDSEKRLRSVIENLNVGILKYNAEKEIMIWNHTALQLLGVSAEQIQNKTAFDTGWKAVYEDGTDIPYKSYPHFKAIDTLQPVKNVIMGIYRPGNNDSVWVLVNATPQFFDDGSLECVTVTFTDITEKKKMEAELNAQFKRYKMLMHTSQDFIQILNREGKLLEWNDAFEKHLGYPKEKLIQMYAWDWSPAFTREAVLHILSELKDEGISFEAQHLLNDGTLRSVDVKLHQFLSNGEAFYYASARDITELKNRQWEVEHLNDELRGLSVHIQNVVEQERAALAKEIHDEFGQTFVAISMNAELIKQKIKDKNEQLTKLLNEQIELSHKVILASRMLFNTLYPTMLDDMGLVAAMESYFENSSQKFSGLKFELNTNLRDEVLAKDISLVLYRIFQESMTNISLYAKATLVYTDLQSDGDNIVLCITDNGTGFDVNAVDTKEHHGLLVMRERAFSIDGRFTITSELQKGTSIEVVIPVIRRQANENIF
jgi:PAS domain S-box-containing protein